jgi:O-antigen ligase
MTPSSVISHGAKASLILVFFAFPISVALANIALLFTLLFWLLGCIWGNSIRDVRQALSNPLAPPALALFAWIVLATLWSPADGPQIGAALQKYIKFLWVPVFIGLLQDPSTRLRCGQAFALAMLFTLGVTWLNVWFDFSWTRTQNQGFGVDHTVFKDYIAQGIQMSFFMLMALHHAVQAPTRARSAASVGIAVLAAISVLFLSAGRTGYLALLLSLVVFVVFTMGLRPRRLATAVVVLVSLAAVAFTTSTQLRTRVSEAWHQAQDSRIDAPITSMSARLETSRFVLQASLEHPVFGHGTAAYPVAAPTHFTDPSWCAVVCVHPHNQFTFFLFEQGLVGLALFLWFLLAIARQAWRMDAPRRALMLGFLSVLIVSNMTHSSFWLSTESHFFILMSALLMAAAATRPGLTTPR